MSYYEDVKFELGAAQAALAMDDVYAAALHTRKAEAAFNLGSLPQEVYTACVTRGVVPDDDLIRLDMGGRAMFAPIVASKCQFSRDNGGFCNLTCADIDISCAQTYDVMDGHKVTKEEMDGLAELYAQCPHCGEYGKRNCKCTPIVAKPFNDDGTCPTCGCELPGQHFDRCRAVCPACGVPHKWEDCPDVREPLDGDGFNPFAYFGIVWEGVMPPYFSHKTYEEAHEVIAENTELSGEVYVHCPKHGVVRACKDVENGYCTECSNAFHRELVDTNYNWVERADVLDYDDSNGG